MTYILIPPYLIVAFFVIRAVLKKQPTKKRKWQMGLLTVFLLYLPLGWDVILGRAVFYGLCATEGGVHVYQTVELGPEYFDKNGMPFFYEHDSLLKEMSLDNKYVGRNVDERQFIQVLNVAKDVDEIIDVENNQVLGDITYYIYFGGWFVNYTGFHVSGERCPSSDLPSNYIVELSKEVFLKKN